MTGTNQFEYSLLDTMANDDRGPVALCLKQELEPVEGKGGVFYPPTYADIGYQTSVLKSGTKVASIDSVGSQANRMEPIFMRAEKGKAPNPLADLVPQIDIEYAEGRGVFSLLRAGHRLADAMVRGTQRLNGLAREAFDAAKNDGDVTKIAKLAPTTLVFGAWDSRDGCSQEKFPRIVQATIMAEDIDELRRSATFMPEFPYAEIGVIDGIDTAEESKDEAARDGAKDGKDPASKMGYRHVPAGDKPGGIIAHGAITRTVTVNLVAVRRLAGNGENCAALRRYILGLSLVAAAEPLDGFLRQGCLLTLAGGTQATWELVKRDGSRTAIDLTPDVALALARQATEDFGGIPNYDVFKFDVKMAQQDIEAGAKGKSGKGGKGGGRGNRSSAPPAPPAAVGNQSTLPL